MPRAKFPARPSNPAPSEFKSDDWVQRCKSGVKPPDSKSAGRARFYIALRISFVSVTVANSLCSVANDTAWTVSASYSFPR